MLLRVVVAWSVLETLLREDPAWGPLVLTISVVVALTLLWRRTHPLAAVAVAFGTLIMFDVPRILTIDANGLLNIAALLVLPYALFRWGSGREAADRPAPFGEFLKTVHHLQASGKPQGAKLAGFYLSAFARRRAILAEASGKLDRLLDLLPAIQAADRTILFTQTQAASEGAVDELECHGVGGEVLHSGMDMHARAAVFAGFEDGTHDLVAAPRLLDEGVDIVAADLGIVFASSRSRRQMIQRIGRVIRKKPDGRAARFAIMFVEGTSEDPACQDHEGFLELVTPHALDVRYFPASNGRAGLADYLRP